MARPIAAIPVQIPIALAFALGSVNAALTKASDATFTIAAPMPWKPRATMSAAMLCESAGHRRYAEHHDAHDVAEPAAV